MNWYNLPPSDSKLLLPFMIQTIKPIEVTVGKFGVFSLQYFASVNILLYIILTKFSKSFRMIYFAFIIRIDFKNIGRIFIDAVSGKRPILKNIAYVHNNRK